MHKDIKAKEPTDPEGMQAMLEKFLDWLRVKNFSEQTITVRRKGVGCFIAWATERGIERPNEVTPPIVERFQRYLFNYRKKNGDPLTVRTQSSRLYSLKAFFRWLAKRHHILYNPAGELEMPRSEFRLPKAVLTAQEAELVLSLPDVSNPLGLRDRAILEVFYSTGMRRMELLNLTVYDIDRGRGTVLIRQGKGKKDRIIPIGERAVAWIEKYLQESRPKLIAGGRSGDLLFISNLGDTFHPVAMTSLVRDYVLAAELGKVGSCHLLRHTMATLMLEGGADIRFIQAMLGHASLQTTQLYTQVSARMLKQVHTATHPANSKQQNQEEAAGRDAAKS